MPYVVEVATATNSNVLWPFTQDMMRGRWDFGRTAHRSISQDNEGMKTLAREVRSIPGLYVMVDKDTWTGRLFDPMVETEDGRKIKEKLDKVYKQYPVEFGGQHEMFKTKEVELTADTLKHWLEKMVQGVSSEVFVVVPGSEELPTMDEVLSMPGRISNNLMSGKLDMKEKDDPNDPRPLSFRDSVRKPPNCKRPETATAD